MCGSQRPNTTHLWSLHPLISASSSVLISSSFHHILLMPSLPAPALFSPFLLLCSCSHWPLPSRGCSLAQASSLCVFPRVFILFSFLSRPQMNSRARPPPLLCGLRVVRHGRWVYIYFFSIVVVVVIITIIGMERFKQTEEAERYSGTRRRSRSSGTVKEKSLPPSFGLPLLPPRHLSHHRTTAAPLRRSSDTPREPPLCSSAVPIPLPHR